MRYLINARLVARPIIFALVFGLVACAEIDAVDSRVEVMNRGVANYYNEAILLNVIRASRSEPLAFVSLSSVVGHNTLTGNVGLPSITVGPHTPATATTPVAARNFVFGPNSVSRAASNDFTANVIDDPLSYQGLLAPTNPATLGFFINQGYSRELLFFLFVERMRLIGPRGEVIEEYENSPVGIADFSARDAGGKEIPSFQRINSECFQNYLAFMIREGLTAQIDIDALPVGRASPANRLCADPGLTVWFRESTSSDHCKGILSERNARGPFRSKPTPGRLRPICDSQMRWTIAKPDSGSKGDSGGGGGGGGGVAPGTATATVAAPTPVTVTLANTTNPERLDRGSASASSTANVPVTVSIVSPPATPPKPKTDKSDLLDPCSGARIGKIGDPRASYELCLDGKFKVQVYLRSAYAIYEFLGKLLARNSTIGLYTGLEPDLFLFTVTGDHNYCFVNVSYAGQTYCVPTKADNTKRIFALLRQLVGLNTQVTNQPSVLTVRTTP